MKTDTCGCCEPAAMPTPVTIDNRPGLSAIAYRVGTFAAFRQAMLQAIAGAPGLAHLRTRLSDDYAITLLEMWAVVADILTFYQERIANEAYLRTARHRDSVLRLARLLDYRPKPGVAALAKLAFTVEKGASVRIPAGLRAQSVPGQDEKPQKYEVLEEIRADWRLNRLDIRPAPVEQKPLAKGAIQAYLRPDRAQFEAAAVVAPGDRLVVFKKEVTFEDNPPELLTVEAIQSELDQLRLVWQTPVARDTWDKDFCVRKVKRTLRLFGYNAPETFAIVKISETKVEWEPSSNHLQYPLSSSSNLEDKQHLCLDGRYDDIKPGTVLLIVDSGGRISETSVQSADQVHDTLNPTSGTLGPLGETVTRVEIDGAHAGFADRRKVLVYELEGPEIPIWNHGYAIAATAAAYVTGRTIDAETIEIGRTIQGNTWVPGTQIRTKDIERGRAMMVVDQDGMTVAASIEQCSIKQLAGRDYLELRLQAAVTVDPQKSPALLGNIALASHGETVKEEVLGDGDASAAFQTFRLKKKPVTYVPGQGPAAAVSSLQVRVDQTLWQEAPSLYGRGSADPVYTARLADDGTLSVGFGDGQTGARLPSGRGNVRARYRQGLGLAGCVAAQRIKTLLDRPVGLKSVVNPMAAEGGADPETLAEARSNAPGTVRTFDRAVSLQDFEYLACATGEVAKCRATWVWTGWQRAVHLTVAGQQGGLFSDEALQRIHDSLTSRRDPNYLLRLDNFIPVPVVVSATLGVHADRTAAEVVKQARAALTAALSFDNLPLGMPLHLSDIYAVLQAVEGVSWVDIDRFQFKDGSAEIRAYRGTDGSPVQAHLRIYPARPDPAQPFGVRPAEQAWVEAPTEDILIFSTAEMRAFASLFHKIPGIQADDDIPPISR